MTSGRAGVDERERRMTTERFEQIRAAAGSEFNPGTIAVSAAWELIAEVDSLAAALEKAGPDPVALRSMAEHVVACWNQLGRCEDEFNPDPGPYCGEYAEHLDSAISAMANWLESAVAREALGRQAAE